MAANIFSRFPATALLLVICQLGLLYSGAAKGEDTGNGVVNFLYNTGGKAQRLPVGLVARADTSPLSTCWGVPGGSWKGGGSVIG